MQFVVWTAFIISLLVCIAIGALHSLRVRSLADVLPVIFGRNAKVASAAEFSSSTVAATISLATVVVAFYELVPALGVWLLWPAITTAMGLAVFGLLARRIWRKISGYEFRPTIHAYLGTEYASNKLALVASVFTAIGYLTAFAVELTVGGRFLGPLLPGVPTAAIVVTIAVVSFVYTGLGGFRTVVVTDRLQMGFIWLLIGAMCGYYFVALRGYDFAAIASRIPSELRSFSWTDGRASFVLGILVMNLLTYVSNMGLWQRIAGSENSNIVSSGLWRSVASSAISWSLLALIALFSFTLVQPIPGENLLITTLRVMQTSNLGLLVIFCVVLGLLGAMLSTASTQLMAVSHTVYEDIIAPYRKASLRDRVSLRKEAWLARAILVACAVLSVGVVEGLLAIGFSVADMAFAVYGAALGLVPPILISLYVPRAVTSRLSTSAMVAVPLGFLACWAAAAYGRIYGNGNLIFLSPIISTAVASAVMAAGWLRTRFTDADFARLTGEPDEMGT
jgi:Na+/proline symporter